MMDGNDRVCECGHLLEDHEVYIEWACTQARCSCLSYEEREPNDEGQTSIHVIMPCRL